MATGAGAGKSYSQLSVAGQKEIKSAAEFANSNKKKMKDLEANFLRMGALKLYWDSKVPEKNKSFFHRFSFKCSDRIVVVSEIKKYLDFYQAMSSAMGKLNGEVEKTEPEASDPLVIINDLKTLITEMDKEAEWSLPDTDSSAVFKLHSEFIEKHAQLESLVNRAESFCLTDKIRSLNNLIDSCHKTMHGLQVGLQDFQKMKEGMQMQIVELVAENEKQREHQQSLVAMNEKLREDRQKLAGAIMQRRLQSSENALRT